MAALASLSQILATLEPVLHEGSYVYCCLADSAALPMADILGLFREAEGVTAIVREDFAQSQGWQVLYRAAWITLNVHSDLAAVGLTAAFAAALGERGISCNVVAGAYHDHLFVPVDRAHDAMQALRRLQDEAKT